MGLKQVVKMLSTTLTIVMTMGLDGWIIKWV
jgi:hypothetical protein